MNPSTDEKPFVTFLKAPSAFKWVLFEGCLPNSSRLRKQNHVIPGYPTYSVGYVDYNGRIAHLHGKSKECRTLCTLNKDFGCKVATKEDKPTNGEFIAMLSDKFRLEQQSA